jgi:hypothetical protein
MLAKAKAGMKNALWIAVAFIVLVGISRWAQGNPEEWQAAIDSIAGTIATVIPKIVTALGNLIVWILDQIAAATA